MTEQQPLVILCNIFTVKFSKGKILSARTPPLPQGWLESEPPIFCRHPLKNEIRRVYFLSAPLKKKKKKNPKGPNLVGFFEENIRTLLGKNMPSLGGGGGGGADKKRNF